MSKRLDGPSQAREHGRSSRPPVRPPAEAAPKAGTSGGRLTPLTDGDSSRRALGGNPSALWAEGGHVRVQFGGTPSHSEGLPPAYYILAAIRSGTRHHPKRHAVPHPRPRVTRMSLTAISAGPSDGGVVSRIEESRRQFLLWAMWKKAGGTVAQDPQAAEIDDLIAGMPAPLKQTLVEVYLQGGGRSERAGSPVLPKNMIVRRLGQADRLLRDQLSVRRARRLRDEDAARMALRLQATARAK